MDKNEFLLSSNESDENSSDISLIIDKAQEGELQIEQMEDNNAYNVDIEKIKDKPWLKPGADITDYFNYGFTEKTWLKYCQMQKERRGFVEKYQDTKNLDNSLKECKTIIKNDTIKNQDTKDYDNKTNYNKKNYTTSKNSEDTDYNNHNKQYDDKYNKKYSKDDYKHSKRRKPNYYNGYKRF
ncbi:FIP1 protein [Enterocytozoon bieneusi H348]|nr:FIP1 protein [Enterocytozoon bieneusi H348]|eukprot:XP_001827987.1 FIP1 protein [Enterocytozoon bieneusi H348]